MEIFSPSDDIQAFDFKLFIKYFGPGILISMAYLDPGNRSS